MALPAQFQAALDGAELHARRKFGRQPVPAGTFTQSTLAAQLQEAFPEIGAEEVLHQVADLERRVIEAGAVRRVDQAHGQVVQLAADLAARLAAARARFLADLEASGIPDLAQKYLGALRDRDQALDDEGALRAGGSFVRFDVWSGQVPMLRLDAKRIYLIDPVDLESYASEADPE